MDRKKRNVQEFYDPVTEKFVKRSKYYAESSGTSRDTEDDKVIEDDSLAEAPNALEVPEEQLGDDDDLVEEKVEVVDVYAGSDNDENSDNRKSPLLSPVEGDGNVDLESDTKSELELEDEEDRPFRLFEDEEEEEEDDDDTEPDHKDDDEMANQQGMTILGLKKSIGSWLIQSKTRRRSAADLLHLLQTADPHSEIFSRLPKDPRTLYREHRESDVIYEDCEPGEMAYLGIRYSLEHSEIFFDPSKNEIELTAHVDGLPLFRTSPMNFWPILGSVEQRPVFIIALWKGSKQPKSCKHFIKRFLDEILLYFQNGIVVGNKTYIFQLVCLLADTPAQAFLLGMKYHSGYYSCSKCPIRGIYRAGRVCFPMLKDGIEKVRRLSEDFFSATDQKGNICPLTRIVEVFDFATKIILDSMHLIYLGVMKRLLETWLPGIVYREKKEWIRLQDRFIPATKIKLINGRLDELSKYYPTEFQRAPRQISELPFWRAHEYRQFLMYLGYTVLHDILPEEHLLHFVTLQVYTRILTDAEKVRHEKNIELAETLAEFFVTASSEIFGEQWIVYNVHGLLHIPRDVYRFGCLENKSCFMFESFMYTLKHLVRSGRSPLKQAVNRWLEWVTVYQPQKEKNVGLSHLDLSPGFDEYIKYKRYQMKNFVLRGDRQGDQCCLINDHFLEISFFARCKNTGKIFVAGKRYRSVEALYEDPYDSRYVGIYRCKRLTEAIQIYEIHEGSTLKKIYRTPLFKEVEMDSFVCSILLHSVD